MAADALRRGGGHRLAGHARTRRALDGAADAHGAVKGVAGGGWRVASRRLYSTLATRHCQQPLPTTTAMSIDRRDFVGRIAGGALLAGLPLPIDASIRALAPTHPPGAEEWDLSWVKRL